MRSKHIIVPLTVHDDWPLAHAMVHMPFVQTKPVAHGRHAAAAVGWIARDVHAFSAAQKVARRAVARRVVAHRAAAADVAAVPAVVRIRSEVHACGSALHERAAALHARPGHAVHVRRTPPCRSDRSWFDPGSCSRIARSTAPRCPNMARRTGRMPRRDRSCCLPCPRPSEQQRPSACRSRPGRRHPRRCRSPGCRRRMPIERSRSRAQVQVSQCKNA